MNKLVLVRGFPGSGKSTLSNLLLNYYANNGFKYNLIDSDQIDIKNRARLADYLIEKFKKHPDNYIFAGNLGSLSIKRLYEMPNYKIIGIVIIYPLAKSFLNSIDWSLLYWKKYYRISKNLNFNEANDYIAIRKNGYFSLQKDLKNKIITNFFLKETS